MSDAAPDTTGLREVEAVRGKELLCESCGCTHWYCLTKFGGACCDLCEHPASEPDAGDVSDHAALTDERQRVTENPQEFLMRTLSEDQWRVVADCLRIEVSEAVERECGKRLADDELEALIYDAAMTERAAWATKIETLADAWARQYEMRVRFPASYAADLRALLSADDTEATS